MCDLNTFTCLECLEYFAPINFAKSAKPPESSKINFSSLYFNLAVTQNILELSTRNPNSTHVNIMEPVVVTRN